MTVDRIAGRVRQLTRPYSHTERFLTRVGDRQRVDSHHARHPSLLTQLRQALEPGPDDEPSPRSADPAAPIALGALDVLMRIEAGSAYWVNVRLGGKLRATCEGNLRALVGAATSLDEETLDDLAADVEAWWRWARVEAAWDGRPRDLRDPCPWCGQRALRVAWDVSAAWCRQCAATWGQTEVGMLGAMLDEQRDAG